VLNIFYLMHWQKKVVYSEFLDSLFSDFCFNSFDYFDKLSNDTADHFDPLQNSRGIMERLYFVLLVA
jgi:hypothetical protein